MRRNIYFILITTAILSGVYHFFDHSPDNVLSLFFYSDFAQDIQWYIKDSADKLNFILLYLAIYKLTDERLIKALSFILMMTTICELATYWLFYMDFSVIIKYSLVMIWSLIFLFKNAK